MRSSILSIWYLRRSVLVAGSIEVVVMEVAAVVVFIVIECCEVYCFVAKTDRCVFKVRLDAQEYASDLAAELQNLQLNVPITDV